MSQEVKFEWISDSWDNVLIFFQKGAEPFLFTSVIYQIATMVPFPAIPNPIVQIALANIFLSISSITFLLQQITLDIAGASIIKNQEQWTKIKCFGVILVSTTIVSVILAVLTKMAVITPDIKNNSENILIIFRAVLAVVYGSLIKTKKITVQPTPPGVQTVQTSVQIQRPLNITAKAHRPKAFFNLYAITEEDSNVVQSVQIPEPAPPTEQDEQDNFVQIGKSHLRLLAPEQKKEIAPPTEQEKNTEELKAFSLVQAPRQKKKEWTPEKDLMLEEILIRNNKATAREIAQVCDCSPTTANAKKNKWKEEHLEATM